MHAQNGHTIQGRSQTPLFNAELASRFEWSPMISGSYHDDSAIRGVAPINSCCSLVGP
jgi:hypothetical protein